MPYEDSEAFDDAFDDAYDDAYDDAFDDALDDAFDDAEATRQRNNRPVARAATARSPYTRNVRGRNTGRIKTPNGPATVQLPARFPTVGEFRETLSSVQTDIKRNSTGIASLGATNDRQDARLVSLNRQLRRSAKVTFWTSIILGTITIGPHLLNALTQNPNPNGGSNG